MRSIFYSRYDHVCCCILLALFGFCIAFTSVFSIRQSATLNSTVCQTFRADAPFTIDTALVVGDSLFNSESRFRDALQNELSAMDIGLSPLGYTYVVSGQGIEDLLAVLQAGTLDSDLTSADIFILNLGVNNWSQGNNNLAQVQSWIDQVIAYVSTIAPELVLVWVEPHAVESLVENPNIYTGTQRVAAYLNQKDSAGDICLLDWSGYADANPEVYSTATADIDGVHMFGNEGEYVNFIIDNIEPLLNEPTQPEDLFGDTNCDGRVDAVDALFILRYTVDILSDYGSCPLANNATELNAAVADIDGNGDVDVLDALFLLQCSVDLPIPYCDVFE